MKAVIYHEFGEPPELATVDDPEPASDGVVVAVEASGLCRSDWHGWRGHDPDIQQLPHVPGHELAGRIVAVGSEVRRWRVGQRVTTPFVAGCGECGVCRRGDPQICPDQFQPGFTAWGSHAELVGLRYADANLVTVPESMPSVVAASLGCRLATAYRAVVAQGRVAAGDWVAVFGCGGVGLSAVMIARAHGARVLAVDVRPEPLSLAVSLGADVAIDASSGSDVPSLIHDLTDGGADVAIDALGSLSTFVGGVLSLRRRGRHVQVGLLAGDDARPPAPMERVIGWELELVGSHGLQASAYPELFGLIDQGRIDPGRLLDRTIPLGEAPDALASMGEYSGVGVSVIDLAS